MTTSIDIRIADMLGGPVIATGARQRDIRGILVARESAHGVVETALRGCRRRRRIHLRYVRRDWFPA
jgi:hypothetical protein